ncbi:MAG: hypothetical protein HDR03_02700 [Lachnospiraceae bacterium]|nr:hypothetical protein [Lachnospiraceae bacterium]
MKYLYVLLFLLIGTVCCACGANTVSNSSLKEDSEQFESVQRPAPKEYTLEELTDQTADFRDYIVNFYQQVQELAQDDESYDSGKKLAKEVAEQYGERITELADIDFTGMTEDELKEYQSEFASLTTVIREAKDALTLG